MGLASRVLWAAALCGAPVVLGQSYDDWSWVKSFAAVGDSFTAGIGAGGLYTNDDAGRKCSRYDQSYPVVMQRFMGGVQTFQYPACSGATSVDILAQIEGLAPGIDLAVLTAGGNDLCLSNIIAQCILSRLSSMSDCQAALDYATSAVGSYLEGNIQALLQALDAKMNQNGIIVLVQYAQYFDSSTDACATEQWGWPLGGLALTRNQRNSFDALVRRTNEALSRAANGVATSNAKVIQANWDNWSYWVGGQFCEPGQNPNPADPSNANLLFFKLDTTRRNLDTIPVGPIGPIKARANVTAKDELESAAWTALEIRDRHVDDDLTNHTVSYEPPRLARRGVTAPGCPSGTITNVIKYLLPDGIGKIFHPTVLGHQIMASFALDQIRGARARLLHIDGPGCVTDTLECLGDHNTGNYASAYALYSQTQNFCNAVAANHPSGTNWQYSQTYYQGTPDQVVFTLTLSGGASSFDLGQCNKALNAILDQCDKYATNPMNWKQGGINTMGSYQYEIRPTYNTRLWPYPTEPKQSCHSSYKFFLNSYDIYGAGWATWDWGQQSLRPNSTSCFGLGITNWHFEYFDQPDANGYEWHAWFNSPVFTRARCFNNNKVQNSAGGGPNGGCGGSG
ncbi:hypothetical protein VTK73DRAFT_4030 [Phialemonium thermophilum]|uniref:SGNH hydrolase-type esterase domain-containing protein n=1 Tax=Phialemonium thermophilum TaxID=223376 RepID=A0ABR3WVN8_9PEZI